MTQTQEETLNTYELSLTKTSYEVTTVQAETPEEARAKCEAFHFPDSVEIHSINEVNLEPEPEAPENQDQMLDEHLCTGCVFDTDDFDTFELGCAHPRLTDPTMQEDCFTKKPKPIETDCPNCPNCLYNVEEARDLSGCTHPDNDGDWRSEFWSQGTEMCFMPKMPIIGPGDTVFETTEFCASCGGVMLMSGDKEWCSVCAKLIPLEGVGVLSFYIRKRNPKNRHTVTLHAGPDCPHLRGEVVVVDDIEGLTTQRCAWCFG